MPAGVDIMTWWACAVHHLPLDVPAWAGKAAAASETRRGGRRSRHVTGKDKEEKGCHPEEVLKGCLPDEASLRRCCTFTVRQRMWHMGAWQHNIYMTHPNIQYSVCPYTTLHGQSARFAEGRVQAVRKGSVGGLACLTRKWHS